MDFTYSQLQKICAEVVKIKKTITAQEIPNAIDDSWVIFKHDVETNVEKALKMATIEAEHGIKATYYVQGYLLEDNVAALQKIADLGHEVTYHYDVLDANKGDYTAARQEFVDYVNAFEKHGFKVNTICPHGNPVMIRNGWNSNKDFFRKKEIAEEFNTMLDVVVQLPTLLNGPYTYISDAGFQFQIIRNVENNDIKNDGDIHINSIQDFVKIIQENQKIIFSTHPHRWKQSKIATVINKLKFKLVRSVAVFLAKSPAIKKILSRFYYLAKKI
ncbi:MAG: hypothetical protein AAF617_10745 [Bacteroidota bacterium]